MITDFCVLCCCPSDEAREAIESKKRSDDIDRQILAQLKSCKNEFKLLLLGSGESGKSTFLKQMKIIHGDGFPEKERKNFTSAVHHNLCVALQTLVRKMDKFHIAYSCNANVEIAARFLEVDFTYRGEIDEQLLKDCCSLWADLGIQECYSHRKEFYMQDSASYFLPKTAEVTHKDYIPSTQDILHARVPTSGVAEYSFNWDPVIFRIVDVGGQRKERSKWIHCFENVTSILYLAALSEYDQRLCEDEGVNRLEESLALFHITISSRWFQRSSVMLFLNKKDIFEEKILYSHLENHFSDYHGERENAEEAKKFILTMFHEQNEEREKIIYSHFTCATDTENIKFVFNAVKDTILQGNLEDYNLA